ncbi:MAG: YbhB/YbcL family Raf kinase inhibitor-like protein [Methylotenera sp.]|nr:YbhB/YbcL family Raf kinase inhibitor-like protein [Oligoflexia bacterium]
MSFKLSSPAFENGQEIGKEFSGEGSDISPPLKWSQIPGGTQEFVLICEDPDAPGASEPFVHWLIYNISPSISQLPKGISPQERLDLPIRADQGTNSFHKVGYGGPMPPVGHGWHRYIFRLFALDAELGIAPGANKMQLLEAMKGHILAEAECMGRYQRVDSKTHVA